MIDWYTINIFEKIYLYNSTLFTIPLTGSGLIHMQTEYEAQPARTSFGNQAQQPVYFNPFLGKHVPGTENIFFIKFNRIRT